MHITAQNISCESKLTWMGGGGGGGGGGAGEGSTHLVEADHQAKPNTTIQHPFFSTYVTTWHPVSDYNNSSILDELKHSRCFSFKVLE